MALEEEYMNKSVELLDWIAECAADTNKRINSIDDAATSLYFTVDEYIKSVIAKKADKQGSEPAFATKLDAVVTRIDSLLDRLGGTASGGTGFDDAILKTLSMDITGFGKSLMMAVPYFSQVRPYIPVIADTVNQLVIELGKSVKELSPDDAKKFSGITAIMGADFKKFSISLAGSITHFKIASPFMGSITSSLSKFVKGFADGVLKSITIEEAEKIGKIMSLFSVDFHKFASNIASSVPYLKIMQPFMGFVGDTIGQMIAKIVNGIKSQVDTNDIGEIGEFMQKFSNSLLKFVTSLALVGPLAIIAIPGILAMSIVLPLVGRMIRSLGSNAEQIETGTSTINKMSISLLGFAASLALTGLIVGAIGAKGIGMVAITAITMGLIALEYYIIGKNDTNINKGSLSVLGIAVTLFLFSASMGLSSRMIGDFGSILKVTGALALTALVYAIAGKFASDILMGALSFAAIGISMWLLFYPLSQMGDALKRNPSIIWQLPTLLGALGVVYGIAGVGFEFILLGALAMGAIGASLWVIGKGLQSILSMPPITQEKAEGIKMAIKAVVTGFAESFSDVSLTDALTLPLKIPLIGLMGLSLGSLGWGLGKFKENANNWGPEDTKIVSSTISGLSKAFALAGSTEGMETIFGFPVGSNSVERGVESTRYMGDTLSSLANGILKWKTMNLGEEEMQKIVANISRVLNVIPFVFADIGQREKSSKKNKISFFGMSISDPFEKGDVSAGIKSVKDLGRTLIDLADGIIAWQPGGKMKVTPAISKQIVANISSFMATIPTAFATIGRSEKGTMPSYFGIKIGKGDIEKGIHSVKDLGKTLLDMHHGLEAWMPGGKNEITPAKSKIIVENVSSFLAAIPASFAAIGKMEKGSMTHFLGMRFGKGDIEKGVKVIAGMSPQLEAIANVAKQFNTGQNVAKNITDTIDALIGGSVKVMQFGLANVEDKSFDNVIEQWERFTNLSRPIDAFAKAMGNLTKVLKDQFELFAKKDSSTLYLKFIDGVTKLEKMDTIKLANNLNVVGAYGTGEKVTVTGLPTQSKTAAPANVKTTPVVTTSKNSGGLESKIDELIMTMNKFMAFQAQKDQSGDMVAAINSLKTQLVTTGVKIQSGFPR